MTQEERDALIEECAQKAEGLDRLGREWLRDSAWDNIKRDTAASIRSLIGTPPPSSAMIPSGWKLVPTEPTDFMIASAIGCDWRRGEETIRNIWRAMLKDAPAPQPGEAEDG